MTVPERREDGRDELQMRREERMRYEVLFMLYEAADRCVDYPVEVGGFLRKVGIWQDELDRVLRYLGDREYLQLTDGLPRSVCLTVRGINYIERDCSRRRSIRE